MNANMNEKGRQTKLLAAIAILTMVVCVFAMVIPSVDATDTTGGVETDEGATPTYVAKIGDQSYESITNAIGVATEDDIITLIADVEGPVVIPAEKTITINLAGYSISYDNITSGTADEDNSYTAGATILVKGTLTINDSVGTGSVIQDGTKAAAIHVSVDGEMTINGGSYQITDETTSSYYVIKNLGTVIINGGTFDTKSGINSNTSGSSVLANGWYDGTKNTDKNNAFITINGGSFTGCHYVKNDDYGVMNIYGGTFSGTNRGAAIMNVNVLTIDDAADDTQSVIINKKAAKDSAVLNFSYNETYGQGTLTVKSGTFNTYSIVGMASGYGIGVIDIASGLGTAAFSSGATTINGTITIGDNSIEFNSVQFKSDVMIKEGSIVVSGTITGSSSASITAEGEVKLDGVTIDGTDGGLKIETVDDGESKVIIQNLTLAGSATLGIEKGASVEVPANGKLVNNSTATTPITNAGTLSLYTPITGTPNAKVSNTGTVALAPGVDTEVDGGNIVSTTSQGDSLGLNQNLDSNYEIKTSAFLEKNLVIMEGVTLTVGSNATLDLNGNKLIILGTLEVKNNGSVTSGGKAGSLVIGKTGSIVNNGVLGKDSAIDVTLNSDAATSRDVYTPGTVRLQDVAGIEISVNKKVSSSNVTYTLVISGDVTKKNNIPGTITVNDVTSGKVMLDGDMSIGNGITLAGDGLLEMQSGSTLEITSKGVLNMTGSISMLSGATVNLNGKSTGTFSASTGSYLTNGDDKATYTTELEVSNIEGLVITTTSTTAYDDDVEETVTENRLLLSGSIQKSDENNDASVTISRAVGTPNDDVPSYAGAYVTDTLFIEDTIKTFTFTDTQFTVLGTVTYEDATGDDDFAYTITGSGILNGTMYSVESTDSNGAKTETYYIKTFEAAFGEIDTAVDNELNVYGDVEIDSEMTLGADQTITGGDFKITSTGKFTVDNDATMTVDNMDVQGILVKMADGSFTAAVEFKYSAMSENENGDITYSGFIVALGNAQPGDVIEISKETVVDGSFTIPDQVTVKVTETGSIKSEAGKTVNMTVNGTLVNQGTVDISGTTTVNGSVDMTEAVSTGLCGNDKAITVTGEIVSSAQITESINAVWYQDEDGMIVYTTLPKAAEAVSAMDVKVQITQVGNINDSTAVDLGDIVLNITGTAVFGDLTIAEGSIVVSANGTLTASVSGKTGDDGASAAAVDLSKVSAMSVTSTHRANSQNVQVWSLNLVNDSQNGILAGNVTIAEGTVQLITAMNVDGKDSALTVASGAELVINNVNLTAGSYEDKAVVTVDGMMTVNGTLTVSGIMDVNGTLDVATTQSVQESKIDIKDIGVLNIYGTLNVAESEEYGDAQVDIVGTLVVGSASAASGAVTGPVDFNNGYLKAYTGAELDDAKIQWDDQANQSNAVHTVFYINGEEYMTVYAAASSVAIQTALTDEKFDLVGYVTKSDSYNINNSSYWKADADLTEDVGTNIGSTDAYTKVNADKVPVTVSVGTGISLYIDGIKYTSGDTPSLSVGTHTVDATVDPGYKGDVTIQFNGQSVTGSFTITPEMASAAYEGTISVSASGNITQDSTVVVDGGDSGSGMSLTDYLLIILVVLIVIMAIIVALRMMRS